MNFAQGQSPEVFYRLTVPAATPVVSISTCGRSGYDTFLHLWTETSLVQLAANVTTTSNPIASNDDNSVVCGHSLHSALTRTVDPGTYIIQVEGFSRNSGAYQLNVACSAPSSAPTDAPSPAPTTSPTVGNGPTTAGGSSQTGTVVAIVVVILLLMGIFAAGFRQRRKSHFKPTPPTDVEARRINSNFTGGDVTNGQAEQMYDDLYEAVVHRTRGETVLLDDHQYVTMEAVHGTPAAPNVPDRTKPMRRISSI